MLGLGLFAQISSAMFAYGAAFLIPALQHSRGVGLSTAGLIVAMPTVGLMLTLIAWGTVMDRIGERLVLVCGLALVLAGGLIAAAGAGHSEAALAAGLFVGGMGTGSTNGASGRLIVGWFPARLRGLAMGIRQSAMPLAVALGALIIPPVAANFGIGTAVAVPAVAAGIAAVLCGFGIVDPPRPAAADTPALRENPYRGRSTLWRIHGVSMLLVIPQSTVWTFAFVWLHSAHGWSLAGAGLVVTLAQFLGAAGRIVAGVWSDRVGSRMRPLHTIAIAAAVCMAALAATDRLNWAVAVPIMVIASVITVADNGLAFTAVAEIAGPYWSGRSLGIQNTGQNLASALLPPVFGALIAAAGYPAAFAAAAVLAAFAIPLVPKDTRETAVAK
jgi:MFS family permease